MTATTYLKFQIVEKSFRNIISFEFWPKYQKGFLMKTPSKGQLISKCPFGVYKSPKKQ